MSATRDKNQNPTFVYTNLYRLYRDGEKERNPETHVLKTGDRATETPQVRPYQPVELIGKRVAPPVAPNPEIQSLKDNLSQLKDLHQRLRFMLGELEELTKKKNEE